MRKICFKISKRDSIKRKEWRKLEFLLFLFSLPRFDSHERQHYAKIELDYGYEWNDSNFKDHLDNPQKTKV